MPEAPMKVSDLMTTEVVTIDMDQTLKAAQQIFNQRKFHHLIVVEKGKVVGVISDRDLLKNISPFVGIPFSERPQDAATLGKRIHQMMSRQLVSVGVGATAVEAARTMIHHRVSCLPVIDDAGQLSGIITTRDLLRCMVKEQLGTLTSW